MKVLLVNPPMVSDDRPGYHHLSPPLGIMYIAGFLRENNIGVEILDFVVNKDADVVAVIDRFKPDIVGITSMTGNFPYSLKIATDIKACFNIPIVFGGPHATILPEDVLKHDVIDYIVTGEGEYVMLALTKGINDEIKLEDIPGLGFKKNGELIVNNQGANIENLDAIPFPAYDLIDHEAYITDGARFLGYRHIVMIVSRGCPGKCTFCAQHVTMGRKFRAFSAKRVVDEIEVLVKKYNVEGIWFKDSEFNMNKAWTLQFCEEVMRRNLKFNWTCFTRADGIDKNLAEKLKGAGLEQIWIGAESGSERVLHKVLNKEVSVDKVRNAFRICKEVGLKTSAFFMVGIPTETKEELRMTFELIRDLDSKPMQISIYHPIPGTQLYDDYNGKLITSTSTPSEMAFDKACMSTGPLSKEEVQIAYNEIINYFLGDGKQPEFLYSEG